MLLAALPIALGGPGALEASALRVEILRGDGANNNGNASLATSPVVRVVDANGPVSGALVVFSADETGARINFPGALDIAEAITDESGTAASPRVQPAGGNGPVRIRVVASHQGEFAQAVIHQMNLGFGEERAREAELDVALFPGDKPGELSYRVRVENGTGRPVPQATLAFDLRRIDKSGKAMTVWHRQLISDPEGEARCTIPRQSGGGRMELEVLVEISGERATRYFPLK